MSRRRLNKRATREATYWRRQMVLEAGCVETLRRGISVDNADTFYPAHCQRSAIPVRNVSVPRTLRPILGRRIGGGVRACTDWRGLPAYHRFLLGVEGA